MKQRKAIVLGATGLIGRELVKLLLEDSHFQEVELHGRSALGWEHPKLNEFTGDLLEEHYFDGRMQAHSIFCCIGTTQSKTPDLAIYKKIDYGIPLQAARAGAAALFHGVRHHHEGPLHVVRDGTACFRHKRPDGRVRIAPPR